MEKLTEIIKGLFGRDEKPLSLAEKEEKIKKCFSSQIYNSNFSWIKLFCKDRYKSGITEEDVEYTREITGVIPCNDVRIVQGRFWTTEGYETWRKKILKTPLP